MDLFCGAVVPTNAGQESLCGAVVPTETGQELHSAPLGSTDHQRLDDLMSLAEAFVREGRADMVWGPKTEAMYRGIFRRLLSEPSAGGLAHQPGEGFACAVETPNDTPHGRAAVGFGIYVRPEARGAGLGRQLHRRLMIQLAERGFEVFITGAETPAGAAVIGELEPISAYGFVRLGEVS